jgi:hypothetical protein
MAKPGMGWREKDKPGSACLVLIIRNPPILASGPASFSFGILVEY